MNDSLSAGPSNRTKSDAIRAGRSAQTDAAASPVDDPTPLAAENTQGQFDVEAWEALIEEQKRRIAEVAGVDPSKVKIHIEH